MGETEVKKRAYRIQEPPFNVTLELTQGCNLRCSFCAVAGIQPKQGKGYVFMEKSTLTKVLEEVRDLKWNCRVGFAMRGEPTMHPDYVGMIAETHRILPKAHVTMLTNAGGLLRKPGPAANVKALFDAGLAVLGLDNYEGVGLVPKILEGIESEMKLPLKSGKKFTLHAAEQDQDTDFTFYHYPQDLEGNPHMRRPRGGTKTLVCIRDIAAQDAEEKKGNHGKLFNYAGVGAPANDKMVGKKCHHPFRQIAIRADGTVAICCNDWRGEYVCGDVKKQSVEEIWQGPEFGAAREMLYHGKREMKPCQGCDHRSYRVGLLPDALGQGKVRKPDEQTARDIKRAVSKGPLNEPVLRPWEPGYEEPNT